MALPENYRPIIDGDLALAIGLLITEWSGFQWFLVLGLSELMVGKPIGEDDDALHTAALIGMDARPLIGLYRTLSKGRLGATSGNAIADLLDQADKAKELRDLVCHCVWERNEKAAVMVARTTKTVGKFKETARPVPICDLAFDVCCHLVALERAEASRRWSRRSGRVVLKIALDRLAAHYGLGQVRRKSPIRAWSAQAAALESGV